MTIIHEQRLTLPKAARREDVDPSTVWRWALHGVRGVKLETFSVGVKRFTSVEAIERFIVATTAAAPGNESPHSRTPRQRQRAIERAEKELTSQVAGVSGGGHATANSESSPSRKR